jgi:hypothetical protein
MLLGEALEARSGEPCWNVFYWDIVRKRHISVDATPTPRHEVDHEAPRRHDDAEVLDDHLRVAQELVLRVLDVEPVHELDDRAPEVEVQRARERRDGLVLLEDVPREAARRGRLDRVVARRDADVRVCVHELALLAPHVTVREHRERPVRLDPVASSAAC